MDLGQNWDNLLGRISSDGGKVVFGSSPSLSSSAVRQSVNWTELPVDWEEQKICGILFGIRRLRFTACGGLKATIRVISH